MRVMDYLVSSVNLSFRIHDSQISATNTRDIFGRNQWDVEQTTYAQVGIGRSDGIVRERSEATAGSSTGVSKGKYVFSGSCRLADGSPMAGCVVQLGKDFAVSNSSGEFELRSNKKTLPVAVGEFAAPGSFEVVTAPAMAQAGSNIEIVVRRK